ncbi:MAG: O-antigen ligase family protein, partial [Actinobacteria bacterium]|nr:O-antigen ligase family protein [Actinomycetota bacterium]
LYVVVTQLADRERLYERIIWVLTACSSIAAFLSVGRFLRGDALLAQSAYGNANDLAFILATTLPLSLWLLLRTRRSGKVLVAGMLGVISAGVVLSFSRGALLGLAVALAFYGVTERRHARLFLTGGLVIVVSTVVLVHTNTKVVTRGLNAKGHVAQYNVDTRLVAWSGALQLAADHPLVGIGPGNFGEYYYELTDSPPTVERLRVTHDAYLDVAAELGFTGVVLFLGYLAISFSRLSQAVRRRLGPPGLAPLVRAAMVVALVGMLTHSEEYFAPIWLLGALGTAMWREGSSGSSR